MARKALGRGLNALLGETVEASTPTSALQQVPVDLIDPNTFQPRRVISGEQLRELAESIRVSGVVQPILLRKSGERYQLVAGERRWRAAAMAKLETVPAMVRELSDRDALEIAIAENVLREDLSAVEVARAFQSLHEKFGYSHEEIAARLGMDRSTVTNTLRLLKLPGKIQEMIETKKLTSGHARALLASPSADLQLRLADRIVKEGLSVRQAERLAASPGASKQEAPGAEPSAPKLDPNLRAAVLELERTLGTKVKITGDYHHGCIEIGYYSAQDLNRLFDWIIRK